MTKKDLKEIKKDLVNKKCNLRNLKNIVEDQIDTNTELGSVEEIFTGYPVYNLPEGSYTGILEGNYAFKIGSSNDWLNVRFITVGKWNVIENEYSNINETIIDTDIEILIEDVEVV